VSNADIDNRMTNDSDKSRLITTFLHWYTYIAGADVAYSVSLTTVSTLLCPILTPALAKLLAGQALPVSFWNMFVEILLMVVLPLAIGFAVRYFFGRVVERIKDVFPAVSISV